MRRRAAEVQAGTITDNTGQAVLLARLLTDGHGQLNPGSFAARLLDGEARACARGSLTCWNLDGAVDVGAAVQAGVAGAPLVDAANVAITAAQFGGRCGHWRAVGWSGARLRWATGHHAGLSPAARGEAVDQLIGTSVAGTQVHNSCNWVGPRKSSPKFRGCQRPLTTNCRSYARGCPASCQSMPGSPETGKSRKWKD